MKSYSSRELINLISNDGWYIVRIKGSHHYFRHPKKKRLLNLSHPEKTVPRGTVGRILRQAGIKDN